MTLNDRIAAAQAEVAEVARLDALFAETLRLMRGDLSAQWSALKTKAHEDLDALLREQESEMN